VLAALFSGSQVLGEWLACNLAWLPRLLDTDALRFPRVDQGLRREVEQWLAPALKARAARHRPGALASVPAAGTRPDRGPRPRPARQRRRDHPGAFGPGGCLSRGGLPRLLAAGDRTLRHAVRTTPGRPLGAHPLLRARHGEARRPGTQLQLRRGRAVRVQRRGLRLPRGPAPARLDGEGPQQPRVLPAAGRGLRRGSGARHGRGHALPDRPAPATGGPGGPAGALARELRELLRPVRPDVGADDADQGPPGGGRRRAGRGVPRDGGAVPVSPAARGRGDGGNCSDEAPPRERNRAGRASRNGM
jgi:hypothetical protein